MFQRVFLCVGPSSSRSIIVSGVQQFRLMCFGGNSNRIRSQNGMSNVAAGTEVRESTKICGLN